jgi:dolichol-phosphate mannosyltransferase
VTGLPVTTPRAASSASDDVSSKIRLDRIGSEGYSFQIEINLRAWRKGFTLGEIPIVFADRNIGESKMSKRIVWEAVWRVWALRVQDLLGRL